MNYSPYRCFQPNQKVKTITYWQKLSFAEQNNFKPISALESKVVDLFLFLFDLDSMTSQRGPPQKNPLTRASTTNQKI